MSTGPLPRVCLITPGHLATNPRIVKEADALSEAGYGVTVVAADFLDWAHHADAEFADRAWHVERKVSFGPRAPIERYLKQTIRRKTCRALTRMIGPNRFLIDRALHPAAPELVEAALSIPAELYIAHYTAALPAAAAAANRFGTFYAFDAEDFHLGALPEDAEYAVDRTLIRVIEEDLLRNCVYLTAASPGIADAYVATYGLREPTVLLNVFPRANAPTSPTPAGTASPTSSGCSSRSHRPRWSNSRLNTMSDSSAKSERPRLIGLHCQTRFSLICWLASRLWHPRYPRTPRSTACMGRSNFTTP